MKTKEIFEIEKTYVYYHMSSETILTQLHQRADPTRLKHMKKYGINTENALGISIHELRKIAKEISKNHRIALELWDTGIHEARLLACFLDHSDQITSEQMDAWAKDFNSWDLCDQACTSLFDLTPLSWEKVFE